MSSVPKRSLFIGLVIVVMMLFSSCTCIYFNTFHNIRKNFKAAEKTREKDARETARGSEVKQYNDAISKASRVLERHPTSSWVDDALYIIGASYYYLGEYDKSARKFKELFANYPESEFIPRSRLLMAKAKLELNEETEAVVIFEEIFESDASKSMKADAARALGEYYFEAKEYDRASVYFQSLIDSLGQQDDKLRALLFIADGDYERFAFTEALNYYNLCLKQNPDTLQTYQIKYRIADCHYFLDKISAGQEMLRDLEENELYYDSLAAIRLKLAKGYEWDGDLESAIHIYEKIAVESQGENAAAVAYYNLGLIYQYDYEDLDRALEYFQKARDERSNSTVREDATRRASTLTTLERFAMSGEQAAELDSLEETDQSRIDQMTKSQYMLGELYYWDLEKPDSALNAYAILLQRFPKSEYAPKALMSMAYIYRDERSDTATADSLLRQVLIKYAHYDEAQDVIAMLGLAGTIADTGYAAIPFAKAEGFFERFEELDSTDYYIRTRIDSLIKADTLNPDDSVSFIDSLFALGTWNTADSMEIEDLVLAPDSGVGGKDTVAGPIPQPVKTPLTPREDSIRVADSIKYVEARWAADSIRIMYLEHQADSLQSIDSVRAAQLRRQVKTVRDRYASAEGNGPPLVITPSPGDDTEVTLTDLLEAQREETSADSIHSSDSGAVETSPDTSGIISTADTLKNQDTTAIEDSLPAAVPADMPPDFDKPIGVVDTSQSRDTIPALEPPQTPDTVAKTDTVPVPVDTAQKLDTTMAIDNPQTTDIESIIDSLPTPIDSSQTSDTTLVLESPADGDIGADTVPVSVDTTQILDTTMAVEYPPTSDTEIHADSLPIPIDTASTQDSAVAGEAQSHPDTLAVSEKPGFPDTLTVVDTTHMTATGSGTGKTTAPTEHSAVVDSSKIVPEEPAIDYWGLAFEAARAKYRPELMALLDSARYYYDYVIDSFPYSNYGTQARYVKLWMYDTYLAPGDSGMIDLYTRFVDSFPKSDFAMQIADEYNIRAKGIAPRPTQPQQQQQNDDEAVYAQQGDEADSSALTGLADSTSAQSGSSTIDETSTEYKWITDADGNILEPANQYFRQTDRPFEYPWEAAALDIQDKLYFQIRIDFTGKVVDVILMNPTQSGDLNEGVIETVKNSFFDATRIPAKLYDGWFYYTFEVRPPNNMQ